MKKTIFAYLFTFLVATVFVPFAVAEIEKPQRRVEFGTDVFAAAANNWFRLTDFYADNGILVLDLNKMHSKLKHGLKFGTAFDTGMFLTVNSGDTLRVTASENIYGAFNTVVSRDFLKFLAKGNSSGKINTDVSVHGAVFSDSSVSFMSIFDKIGVLEKFAIKVTPSVFVPLVYITPDSSIAIQANTDNNGIISAHANADVTVYSLFDMENSDFSLDPNALLRASGIDFSLYAEYPLLEKLDVGVNLRHIPLVPARLSHRMHIGGESNLEMDVMDAIIDGVYPSMDSLMSDFTVAHSNRTRKIFRPFSMGVLAAYRPWVWFTFTPSFDIVFDQPVFVEYGLKADFHWKNWVAFSVASNYKNLLFMQQLGLMFNLRVFQLNILASSSSQNLWRSFTGTGFGAGVGIRIGY